MFTFCSFTVLFALSIGNVNGGRSYIGSTFDTDWETAEQYCQDNYGTTLATITNAEENAAVKAAGLAGTAAGDGSGNTDRFYIGLIEGSDDTWSWADGTDSSYRYTFAVSGDGPCSEYITSADAWNDLSCSHTRYFVCNLNS